MTGPTAVRNDALRKGGPFSLRTDGKPFVFAALAASTWVAYVKQGLAARAAQEGRVQPPGMRVRLPRCDSGKATWEPGLS